MLAIALACCLGALGALATWPNRAIERLRPPAKRSARPRGRRSWLDRVFRRQADTHLELATALGHVAAVLRTGVTTPAAWGVIADTYHEPLTRGERAVRSIAQHARLGYPLSESGACRALGAAGAALIAAEAVSLRTGAALGPLLHTIAASIRAEVDAESQRKSAYAGPRATMRVLAALPLGAVGLGYLMGADPIAELTGSTLGHVTLVLGLALAYTGWLVPQRMIHRAEEKAGLR
ncbi:type II secretion system F family protein [Micrococcales bacterium 31B]|nr:type II secretion system F family protein [Micrococcales bacterium 31B]